MILDLESARARQRDIEGRLAALSLQNAETGHRLRAAEEAAHALDTEYFDGVQSLKMSLFDAIKLGVTQVVQRFQHPFQVGSRYGDEPEGQYFLCLPTDTPVPGVQLDLGEFSKRDFSVFVVVFFF